MAFELKRNHLRERGNPKQITASAWRVYLIQAIKLSWYWKLSLALLSHLHYIMRLYDGSEITYKSEYFFVFLSGQKLIIVLCKWQLELEEIYHKQPRIQTNRWQSNPRPRRVCRPRRLPRLPVLFVGNPRPRARSQCHSPPGNTWPAASSPQGRTSRCTHPRAPHGTEKRKQSQHDKM